MHCGSVVNDPIAVVGKYEDMYVRYMGVWRNHVYR